MARIYVLIFIKNIRLQHCCFCPFRLLLLLGLRILYMAALVLAVAFFQFGLRWTPAN